MIKKYQVSLFAEVNRAKPAAFESVRIHLTKPIEVRTDIHLGGFVSVLADPVKRFAFRKSVTT